MKDSIPTASIEFIRNAIETKKIRLDGRQPEDFRAIKITLPKPNEITGKAEVLLGKTRVLATVTSEIVEPHPGNPTEGNFQLNVDFSLMSSPEIEIGRPPLSQRAIAQVVESTLKDSDAIDTESLCIIANEKVWSIRCDVHVLDDCGNAIDCISIAAAAALLHYRRPAISIEGHDVVIHPASEQEAVSLGIHHLPLCVTFYAFDSIDGTMVVDATTEEAAASVGQLTVAVNAHGELCGARKFGGTALPSDALVRCVQLAKQRCITVTHLLRENLEAAGQKLPRAFAIADVSKLYSNTTTTTTSSKSTTTTLVKPSNEKTTSSSTADGAGAIVHAPSGSLPSVLSSSGTSHRPSLLSNTVVDAMLDNDNDALPSSVLELAARVTNFENDNESTDDNDDSSSEEEARVETLQ